MALAKFPPSDSMQSICQHLYQSGYPSTHHLEKDILPEYPRQDISITSQASDSHYTREPVPVIRRSPPLVKERGSGGVVTGEESVGLDEGNSREESVSSPYCVCHHSDDNNVTKTSLYALQELETEGEDCAQSIDLYESSLGSSVDDLTPSSPQSVFMKDSLWSLAKNELTTSEADTKGGTRFEEEGEGGVVRAREVSIDSTYSTGMDSSLPSSLDSCADVVVWGHAEREGAGQGGAIGKVMMELNLDSVMSCYSDSYIHA